MESDLRDKYESDNLIWQLEITFKKLSTICKKNAKLVDYINKKVDKTVSDWRCSKDNFKKLTWAEMDDSDLDLDLDITLPSPLSITKIITPFIFNVTKGESDNNMGITPRESVQSPITPIQPEGIEPEQSISQIDHDIANPEAFSDNDNISEGNTNPVKSAQCELEQTVIALIHSTMVHKETDTYAQTKPKPNQSAKKSVKKNDPVSSSYFVEEKPKKSAKKAKDSKWSTISQNKNSKKKTKKKKIKGKLMFVQQKLRRRKKKMEETEKFGMERAAKKDRELRLRMKRAEKHKLEQQKLQKLQNKKLNTKLKEIKHNNTMAIKERQNAIKERQTKAELSQQRIKNNRKKGSLKVNKKMKILSKKAENTKITMEQNLNKRLKNAANKRHQNQLIRSRKNSLSVSVSVDNTEMESINEKKEEMIDVSKYINISDMKRLSGKFLYIPKVVRKSSASNGELYANIEQLYVGTNGMLLGKNEMYKDQQMQSEIENVLRTWLKNTAHIGFGHSKHNKDVLLVMNRLICFDINQLGLKAAKMFAKVVLGLVKNKLGLELLAYKYAMKLFVFYKYCLNEYLKGNQSNFKSILGQISSVLVKILQLFSVEYSSGESNEYLKFKKQTQSFLLLNLYKSLFLARIGSIFSMCNGTVKVLDGIINVLAEIGLVLNNSVSNAQICDLINGQIQRSNFAQIIPFVFRLFESQNLNKKVLAIISKSFHFGVNCVSNKYPSNKAMMGKILIKNKEKLYKMCESLFDFIAFDTEESIKQIENVFKFITILAFNNRHIQDIFDKNLLCKLCKNMPFYFVLSPKGQNVLFPLLIALSVNHSKNLNIIKLSFSVKHLKVWLKKNIYKNSKFEEIIPKRMWANCLRFYDV